MLRLLFTEANNMLLHVGDKIAMAISHADEMGK